MPLYALEGHRPAPPEAGNFWIAPDAHVIGRVRIGQDASIWIGAIVRGDNERIDIGERSNIQDGAVLHTDPGFRLAIADDCSIGHRAILHGCIVGAGSLVGMGATILNGVVIGRGSLVGANALVTEGKVFADNSLIVGAPAKMLRVLDPDAVERLKATAARYVLNWRRFAAHLSLLSEAPDVSGDQERMWARPSITPTRRRRLPALLGTE
jgi:carbonic anhydrase/acetyltransferase-like protein (isoleucine patch superfamily)